MTKRKRKVWVGKGGRREEKGGMGEVCKVSGQAKDKGLKRVPHNMDEDHNKLSLKPNPLVLDDSAFKI